MSKITVIIWDKLSAVYSAGSVVCTTCIAIFVSEIKISSKLFSVGIYLLVIMSWISDVPLDDAGKSIGEIDAL